MSHACSALKEEPADYGEEKLVRKGATGRPQDYHLGRIVFNRKEGVSKQTQGSTASQSRRDFHADPMFIL